MWLPVWVHVLWIVIAQLMQLTLGSGCWKKGLGNTSLYRIFGVVKAIVNFCIRERGLDCKNAFAGVYLPSENNKKRYPIKDTKLKRLQRECVLLDDDIRWLVALISDSGMRLSEAVGLLVNDLVLDAEQPHITLIKHPASQT